MALQIHADRKLPALVNGDALPWIASPEPGVERRMLERSGDEVAMATTIVRYAPGSRFPVHEHALGEEFFVLSGIFSDGDGDYPPGTYVRNPPGSRHAPHSADGCVILVKLRQMARTERETVRSFPFSRWWQTDFAPGVERALLFAGPREQVSLLRLAPGASLPQRDVPGGEELFVIEGSIQLAGNPATLGRWGWHRDAKARQPSIGSADGALLWMKRGHL